MLLQKRATAPVNKKKKKGAQWKRKKKKKKRQLEECSHGYLCQLRKNSSSFSFLFILERKLFGKLTKKIHGPYQLFSFLPIQPNTLKKVFFFLFFLQSFPFTQFHLQTNTPLVDDFFF